jgi:hypothetical protein
MLDFNIDEDSAIEKFFSSNTFAKLSDTATKIYKKDWTEIYKLFLSELKV